LPWSPELIEQFENELDCKILAGNSAIHWSQELIDQFEKSWPDYKLDWDEPLILDLIHSHIDNGPWTSHSLEEELSYNRRITWSLEHLDKHKGELKWYSSETLYWTTYYRPSYVSKVFYQLSKSQIKRHYFDLNSLIVKRLKAFTEW
jgi:hypothetical protein